jgi:pimeloyl-ACP methyl ester carboxylesterase
METTRRDALKRSGLAAAAAVTAGGATARSALADGPSGVKSADKAKKPWYELDVMDDAVLNDVLLFYLSASYQQLTDIGEVLDTATRVDAADRWSWPREWVKTADRVRALGEASHSDGHRQSAGETLMRASTYYRAALHRWPEPGDRRVKTLTTKAVATYETALELLDLEVESVRIPYERTTLPGWLFRATGKDGKPLAKAPLLIIHEGRDAWAEDCLYLARGAMRRGYHCLVFDGPGQGKVLRLQGLPLRPDWERVVTPVVDFAVRQRGVDPHRLALMGLSMGGALAPRAAAFEHRLKLLIANPGVLDWAAIVDGQMRGYLGDGVVGLLDTDPAAFDAKVRAIMARNAFLRWGVDDLMWKHGGKTPSETLLGMRAYNNRPVVDRITARTLVMDGTADPYAQGKLLMGALRAPKHHMLFTAQDTGLAHVQNGALGVSSQRFFDWFDRYI